jgi:hypothetical protein
MKKTPTIIILSALQLLFFCFIVSAHAVILWAYVEQGKVYVEAFTQNGTKIKNAKLVVVDASGNSLLEGVTNAEGKFTFDPPVKDEMTIVMVIDDAHKTEFKLEAADFTEQ